MAAHFSIKVTTSLGAGNDGYTLQGCPGEAAGPDGFPAPKPVMSLDAGENASKGGPPRVTDVLARLQMAAMARPETGTIVLRDLLLVLEKNSFPVLVLVFSLLLVSPLSAVPGATTVLGLTIAAVLAQLLLGRRHVWLPGFLLDRQIPVAQARKALQWMEKPAGWLERCLRPRWSMLAKPPVVTALTMVVFTAVVCAPLMEVIPGSGTSVGAAITLFSAGMLARDGLFVLIGGCLAAIIPVTLWLLIR